MNIKLKAIYYAVTGGFFTIFVGAMVFLGVKYVESLRPDYLTFTYVQNVKRQPAVFHYDEPIQVEGLFYNSSDKPIEFTALVFWSLIGDNRQILQFSFKQSLKPGCSELSFNNYPPDQVVQVTQDLFSKGQDKVGWRIEGHNAVTSPYSGGLQPFRVEDSIYISKDKPLPEYNIEDKLRC